MMKYQPGLSLFCLNLSRQISWYDCGLRLSTTRDSAKALVIQNCFNFAWLCLFNSSILNSLQNISIVDGVGLWTWWRLIFISSGSDFINGLRSVIGANWIIIRFSRLWIRLSIFSLNLYIFIWSYNSKWFRPIMASISRSFLSIWARFELGIASKYIW